MTCFDESVMDISSDIVTSALESLTSLSDFAAKSLGHWRFLFIFTFTYNLFIQNACMILYDIYTKMCLTDNPKTLYNQIEVTKNV